MQAEGGHVPVLLKQAVAWLNVRSGGTYVDCTLGGAGHAAAILAAATDVRLVGLDRDPAALARAAAVLKGRVELVQANLADCEDVLRSKGITDVDGVLMDLGVSSYQLDDPGRGFSFQADGPLDMRMDPTAGETAADLVNTRSAAELTGWLREFGEEPAARRIVGAIVARRPSRPFVTTRDLAETVESVVPRRGRLHPATRTFQALRIAVNDELSSLERGVEAALRCLAVGGRAVVIAFHSLEDRIVKRSFQAHAGHWTGRPEGGEVWMGREPPVRFVQRRPLYPLREEMEHNPRARSARMRAVERVEDGARSR